MNIKTLFSNPASKILHLARRLPSKYSGSGGGGWGGSVIPRAVFVGGATALGGRSYKSRRS